MTAPDSSPPVVVDRWPAQLTSPWGITETARVILTAAYDQTPAELWAWTPSSPEPTPLVHAEWLPADSIIPPDQGGVWRIATSDGRMWIVQGGVGCGGCGSIMQTWTPWTPYRIASAWPETRTVG